jgi:hypothetical protein
MHVLAHFIAQGLFEIRPTTYCFLQVQQRHPENQEKNLSSLADLLPYLAYFSNLNVN